MRILKWFHNFHPWSTLYYFFENATKSASRNFQVSAKNYNEVAIIKWGANSKFPQMRINVRQHIVRHYVARNKQRGVSLKFAASRDNNNDKNSSIEREPRERMINKSTLA